MPASSRTRRSPPGPPRPSPDQEDPDAYPELLPAVPLDAPPALRGGIDRGWQYLQAGDMRNAEREFGAAQKVSPQSPSADSAFGYLALARGRADDALPAFDRALSRQPQYVSYAHWQRINEVEVARGRALGRPRVKLTRVDEMLDVARAQR